MASLAPHCQTLMEAKQASGKTFAEIAAAIGKPEVWTAALFFGNAVTDAETAAKIATEIGLKDEVAVKGLAGKGPGSLGVDGMIVRGQNWEWPPKVSSVVSLHVCVCPAVCGRAGSRGWLSPSTLQCNEPETPCTVLVPSEPQTMLSPNFHRLLIRPLLSLQYSGHARPLSITRLDRCRASGILGCGRE